MSLMLRSPCVAAAHARKNARGQRGSSMTNAEIRAYLLAREAIRKLRTMAASAPPASADGGECAPGIQPPDAD
jgi:hypothetical protein